MSKKVGIIGQYKTHERAVEEARNMKYFNDPCGPYAEKEGNPRHAAYSLPEGIILNSEGLVEVTELF